MQSAFTIRLIAESEVEPFARRSSVAFGSNLAPDTLRSVAATLDLSRALAVFDQEHIVGTTASLMQELTVPGNRLVKAAAIGWVSVYPTHRRQGLLRAMIDRQLKDIRALGESLAILYSSESGIYQRFGFGIATDRTSFQLDPARGAFTIPVDYAGNVDMVDAAMARKMFPAIHDRVRRTQPGAMDRPDIWWTSKFTSEHDDSDRFFLLARPENGGEPDGYAEYRVQQDWQAGERNHIVKLEELIATSNTAYFALWRVLLDLDIIRLIVTRNSPADEPLRWRLVDSRNLQVRYRKDGMWVRILDVPNALNSRCYAVEGRVTIEVHDRFSPATAGRFQLEGSPEGASCKRTGAAPDLVLQIEDLSAAYLGGTRFSELARAGRVVEEVPGALRRADAMFAGDRAPWGITIF